MDISWTCDETVASAVRCVASPDVVTFLSDVLRGVWVAAAALVASGMGIVFTILISKRVA